MVAVITIETTFLILDNMKTYQTKYNLDSRSSYQQSVSILSLHPLFNKIYNRSNKSSNFL
jgi:hypothetical protein